MRLPARHLDGQLIWGRDGSVWAVWEVEALCYAYAPAAERRRLHARVRAALLCLPAQSLLLGVCRPLDGAEVAERMLEGVDLGACPAWADHVEQALHELDGWRLYDRRYFVCARLDDGDGAAAGLRAVAAAARAELAAAFGLPPTPPGAGEVAARRRQAAALGEQLAGNLRVRPATVGQLCWLYARAARRGLDEPPLDDRFEPPAAGGSGRRRRLALASLADSVVLVEGGSRDDAGRPRRHRRYLRVDSPAGSAWQTFACIAAMPARWVFPGGEWLDQLLALPFGVDWCVRIRAVPNAEAQTKAARQARQLASQYEQHDGDTAGIPPALLDAHEQLDDERGQLAANPADRELQATTILALASADLAELEARAGQLAALFEPHEYALARPTGHQTALFHAMLPAAPAPPVVSRDYVQFLLPRDLAAGMPFTGGSVGDPQGMLLGWQVDAGTFQPVLLDPAHGPTVNRSASLAAFGALGSGKSWTAKTMAHATIARGGRIVALDRTADGEYVRFAHVAPGSTQIVTLAADAAVCLDPLRVFQPDTDAARSHTLGFLSLLVGASPTGTEGAALGDAVDAALARPRPTLGTVVQVLADRGDRGDADAAGLARRLRVFARHALARLVFGDHGDVLTLDADCVVFHAPGLALPSREELASEQLAARLLPEQVLSQALLYLVAAVARSIAFTDPARFAAVVVDEAYALTASPQGRALLLELVRDGRKHNAALWLLSQHPTDLGADGVLADLLGPRLVFRQARHAAPAALAFLGLAANEDEGWVDLLEALPEGVCLLRDVAGRTGCVQIRGPTDEHVAAAFDTNPTRHTTRGPADTGEAAA